MAMIPKVEGGYWIVVAITLLMATLVAFEGSKPGGETFFGRTANRLALYLICIPFSFATISFFAGCGLLAYKTYVYLKFGVWPLFTLTHVLTVLDLQIPSIGWLGVDQMLIEILTWSGLASLLL